jgi:hypothetical protein
MIAAEILEAAEEFSFAPQGFAGGVESGVGRTAHELRPLDRAVFVTFKVPVTLKAKFPELAQVSSAVAATRSGCCAPFLIVNSIGAESWAT